jgi:outer membrane receptor protein involved in Fe transport
MPTLIRIILAGILVVSASASAAAQSTTDGAIGGAVKDPRGAVVPGATVTARNEGTNVQKSVTTDSEGRFRVVQLQPGNYTVAVDAGGFARYQQAHVVVEVGRVTGVEVLLGISATTETVEVTAEAPVINTQQQDFSTNINQTSINNLPTNGRRWSNLVILTPGTTPDGDFGLVSFRGISGLLNNNTVDGGDNNQAFFAEERGRTRIPYAVSQSSIREFQVNTSNYSAEYGRAAGGVVNAVTKSGTNEFHGDVFYYIRDNRWGARNPNSFDARGNPLKPQDRRQQFGGSVGGPVVRDRLFFFFTYDQSRRAFPGLAAFFNPNYLNTVNRGNLTSRGLSNAQINTALGFITSLTGTVPRRQDQTIILPKLDWHITPGHTLTVTYNRLRAESPAAVQTPAIVTRGRASFGDDNVNLDFLNLRLTSVLSPSVLNEARFQWGRDNEFQLPQAPLEGEPTTAPGGRSPSVALSGGVTFGTPNFLPRAAYPDERRVQAADTVTVTRGRHTLKFGFDVNRVRDILDNLFDSPGAFSYNNIDDFIIDYTNWRTPIPGTRCVRSARTAGRCYTSNFSQAFGPSRFAFTTFDYAFFAQDDFRVTPRLTLNLGLRYEYQKLPEPQIPNPLFAATSRFPADKDNWGPRFGFAYDLTGDGRTSVRGGYGIYYGRIINSTISNAITNTGVAAGQTRVFVSPASPAAPVFPNVLASASAAGAPSSVAFSPFMENPKIHQADLVFERQVARNTVVSVSALVSLGKDLPTFVDINLARPSTARTFTVVGGELNGRRFTIPFITGARPDPRFGAITEIRSTISSEYEALVFQAERRLTAGLQFQASYTLSRSLDNGQTSQTFTTTNVPFNPFDLSSERGYSRFDRRHKFVASAVWTPGAPFGLEQSALGRAIFGGFTVAPVVTAFSGLPVEAQADVNLSGSSGGLGRRAAADSG